MVNPAERSPAQSRGHLEILPLAADRDADVKPSPGADHVPAPRALELQHAGRLLALVGGRVNFPVWIGLPDLIGESDQVVAQLVTGDGRHHPPHEP